MPRDRILLVDDDPDEQVLISGRLEDISPGRYHLEWASSYREAIERIHAGSFDAVLVDYQLGERNGNELIAELALSGEAPPLILMTGHGDGLIDRAALAAGAFDYLDKNALTGEQLDRALRYAIRHRRAVEETRSRESRFQALVEHSDDGVVTIDAAGRLTYASPAVGRMLGCTNEPLAGRPLSDFVHPSQVSMLQDALAHLRAEPTQPFRAAFRVKHRSGEWRIVDGVAINRLDDPAIAAIVVNFSDVTENLRERRAFDEREELFRAVFAEASDAFLIADSDARYVAANRAASVLMGLEIDQIIGRRVSDFSLPSADFDAAWRAFLNEGRMSGSYAIARPDGTTREVEFAAVAHVLPDRHLSVLRDVSDQRSVELALLDSERKFAAVFVKSPLAMYIGDIDSKRIVEANPAFVALTGYPVARLTAVAVTELGIWVDAQMCEKFIGSLELGASANNIETQLRTASGEIRHVLVSLDRLELPDQPNLVQVVISDVTGQKKLQDQFRQAQKMEAIGRLAGGVAHDFNNLLTAILGYSDFVAEDPGLSDSGRAHLTQIQRAADSAAGLTSQLLAFSRRQMMQPQVLDLNKAVMKVRGLLGRVIGEDIKLNVTLAVTPVTVFADPTQIEQILMNLAVNARDAMPDGGLISIETATVTLDEAYAARHPGASAGRHVLLAVSDTGVGMNDEVKSRLFEPFFTTKPQTKGTGLGLSTVYGAVKQMGGSIWVYSEPGMGTTFKTYLPVSDATPEAAQTSPVSHSVHGTETVLLVEDQEDVRRVARETLERGGYTVLEAGSPREALKLISASPVEIELLLTDVVMPEMSGRQLAQLVLLSRERVRVLYMSGYTDDVVVHHGMLEPGLALLQKPFTRHSLLTKVRETLDTAEPPRV